ncbi:MAG: hypothetical protein ACAH83_03895 [Alphaproteobacteria bacterium]
MTSNGIEKQRENPEPIQPLPRLKVLRDTWCDQDTVDRAADYLQANNPDLIREILLEEGAERNSEYFNLAYEVVDYLAMAGVADPATPLGKLDLACEISRRIRKANGKSELTPRGKPLAAGPNVPLPPLAPLAVSEGAQHRGNVTQEMADKVFGIAYKQRPDLWWAFAEEYRHLMCLYAVDEMRALIGKILKEEYGPMKDGWTEGELYIEAVRRVYKMCEITG